MIGEGMERSWGLASHGRARVPKEAISEVTASAAVKTQHNRDTRKTTKESSRYTVVLVWANLCIITNVLRINKSYQISASTVFFLFFWTGQFPKKIKNQFKHQKTKGGKKTLTHNNLRITLIRQRQTSLYLEYCPTILILKQNLFWKHIKRLKSRQNSWGKPLPVGHRA